MGETTTRRIATAALAALLATSCATTPPPPPVAQAEPFDTCGQICAVIILMPFIVTAAVGCVAGGCTRCGEGAPPDTTDTPPPAGESTLLPPRSVDDAMSF